MQNCRILIIIVESNDLFEHKLFQHCINGVICAMCVRDFGIRVLCEMCLSYSPDLTLEKVKNIGRTYELAVMHSEKNGTTKRREF